MEESFPFHYALLDYLLTLVGLASFLLDIVLDVWTVVSFYQDEEYWYMGILICILLGSSVILQMFSWFWYSEYVDELQTCVEKFAHKYSLIKPFHFMQFGVYLRYAGVLEISTYSFLKRTDNFPKSVAVFLNHDLQMLRLIETFSESAPQLTLMICKTARTGKLELITGLKTIGSAAAIACSVVMYHRIMRAFLTEKCTLKWTSTAVYFVWNLLLIFPRVTALALFSSVLPCYIFAHFLSVWILLVLGAWSQKTDFMENSRWEWLYRAAVGLIWYFSWFNVSVGSTKYKSLVYYVIMGLDTMMLLGFWCWKVVEHRGCSNSYDPLIVIPILIGLYFTGIVLKLVYYKMFHPNCDLKKVEEREPEGPDRAPACLEETDSGQEISSEPQPPTQPETRVQRRMRTMARNFYF